MSSVTQKIKGLMRYLTAAMTVGFLIYYCGQPSYYGGSGLLKLFGSSRTYFMIVMSAAMITLALIPNHLSERANRILCWAWFAVAPFAVYFTLLHLNADKFKIQFFELNKIALGFTFWFLFILLTVFLLVTGSIRISVVLLAVPIAILGIANCFVIDFRGMALSGGDLFSVQTAATVASEYEYHIDWYIFSELYLTFLICACSFKLKHVKLLPWKGRLLVLCAWMAAAGSFYHICCRTTYLQDHDIKSEGFTHQLRYKQFDMLFTTLCTCFYLAVDKPEGYSLEKVKEIAAPYVTHREQEAADGDPDAGEAGSKYIWTNGHLEKNPEYAELYDQRPNVIVIMNESLADYTEIGSGLQLSEDNMPFIHNLTKNTIKGTAYASIFGGNTPNSEYEFLTGNTMGFLPPSSVGFNLFVRGKMPSLASQYRSLGYYALAMHPYRGTNYRRNIVYPQIGFQGYYARMDFIGADYIRKYISDQCLYQRIITEYEKNKNSGQPFFSYNVTIQNHGGYTAANNKNLSDSIKVLTPGVDQVKAQQYVNLIAESDKAFQNLTEYFAAQEEPTIIIMFGDHQANLGDSTYLHLIGDENQLSKEEQMEKYKIPFVAWANYDVESGVVEKTSINYLYSILAERLALPMTGYQKYLADLSKEIPVLASGGYWTKEGDFYALDDKESPYYEKINEYQILQYNHIFGKENRYLEFFNLNS